MTPNDDYIHLSNLGSPLRIRIKHLLQRVALVVLVFISILVWPESLDLNALTIFLLLASVVAWSANADFCRVFNCTFSVATSMAIVIYVLSAPLGEFEMSTHDANSSMTDSQYFLYEARRYLSDGDPSALFSTWGGFIPVLYGAAALKVFGGHYLGIVFANSLLYSITIFYAARIFDISRKSYRLLPLFGLLPLQGFYNAMLAKEPIYIFLVVMALAALANAIQSSRISWRTMLVFASCTIVTFIFRPNGALTIGLLLMFLVGWRFGLTRASLVLAIFAAIFAIGIAVANFADFPLALFYLNDEVDGVDFSNKIRVLSDSIYKKNIPASFEPLFLPPWSVILSPFLGLFWLVSPLPMMDNIINAFSSFIDGTFSFRDLAVINRYFDSLLMAMLLFYLFLLRARANRSLMLNPLLLFGIFQVLGIVSLQFFESGRHRYVAGFILVMLVFSIATIHRNTRKSSDFE